jgi:hypothetical protein
MSRPPRPGPSSLPRLIVLACALWLSVGGGCTGPLIPIEGGEDAPDLFSEDPDLGHPSDALSRLSRRARTAGAS